MHDLKTVTLQRTREQWEKCDPEAMCHMSQAAIFHALTDAKRDVIALHDALAAAPTPAAQSAGQEAVAGLKKVSNGRGNAKITLGATSVGLNLPDGEYSLYAAPVNGGERETIRGQADKIAELQALLDTYVADAPQPRPPIDWTAVHKALHKGRPVPEFVSIDQALSPVTALSSPAKVSGDDAGLPPLPVPEMPHGSRDYFSAGQMREYARATLSADGGDDAKLLDWLRDETCDLRAINVPTGGDDFDVRWVVEEHQMPYPRAREIGRSFTDDPRDAIRAAIAASTAKGV
ncbi:hypothetical protein [Pandoraea commovens]|uniref:Uncharacterized protein n=1 Tax=Pandoraea commovens TaxID=2508289 RepID=A0A5E4SGV3_9BURK|nr:hypothetical protein [Pandoraea commovens]VVD75166.1 hypothetical protein PCO31010_00839 [Pandoraea commovens]